MRGKGESALFRVPKDLAQPLRYWQAVIELPPAGDGTRRRKFIRAKSKPDLLDKMAEAKKTLKERGDLPTSHPSVEQWFNSWYENYVLTEVRPKTAAGYRSVIYGHIIPAIGKTKLDKVTQDHVRRVTNKIVNTPKDPTDPSKGYLSNTYALNAHRVMSSAFAEAVRAKKMFVNPAKEMKAPRKNVVALDVLTLPEGIQVLEHVASDLEMGARWATSLLTGARRGEVIGLERDRVTDVLDLSWQLQRLPMGQRGTSGEPGKPVVPADYEYRHLVGGLYLTRPKSRSGWRIVPLVDPLKSILERHMDATEDNKYGLLFLSQNGRPIDPDQDSNNWRDVLEATGIEKDIRLHDLRHTAVDMLYLAGVDEDLIPEIVGHSTRAMSRQYKSRANRDRLIAAMNKVSALYQIRS